MIAVKTAPASTPRIGLENSSRILVNSGTSFSGATALLIVSIPNISTAKPSRIEPISFFLLLFNKHVEHNAKHCQNRGERRRLEHLHKEAVALNARKAENPRRHRGAHVCAHDNADCLTQTHDAGVYKTDNHDCRCGGGLDYCCDGKTKHKAFEQAGGQPLQDGFEFAAALFSRPSPMTDIPKEQRKTAEEGKHIKNIHISFPYLLACYANFTIILFYFYISIMTSAPHIIARGNVKTV